MVTPVRAGGAVVSHLPTVLAYRFAREARNGKQTTSNKGTQLTHYEVLGTGPLYQNRFKAFPVAEDGHYDSVMRDVERAEDWRWGSLAARVNPTGGHGPLPHDGPLPLPAEWVQEVNRPPSEGELEALRRSVLRGCPYGEAMWAKQTATRLGLQASLRPVGRPRKQDKADEQ